MRSSLISDFDLADIEHEAVEVEVALLPDQYIEPVVAEERRLYPHVLRDRAKQLSEKTLTLRLLGVTSGIEILTEVSCPRPSAD